jgi:hypothetical protein
MNHVFAERTITGEIRVRPNLEVGVVEHRSTESVSRRSLA